MERNNRTLFALFCTILLVFIMQLPLLAQDSDSDSPTLEETLQALSQSAAQSYLNPISSAYGSDLNAGWFHHAPKPKKFGFDLEVGFVAMGTFFDDSKKEFSTSGSFRFRKEQAQAMTENLNLTDPDLQNALINEIISNDYDVNISGATVIGDTANFITVKFTGRDISFIDPSTGDSTSVHVGDSQTILPIAGYNKLANIKALPLMAPQFSLGTVLGTQATIRYLPKTRLNDDLGDFTYFGFGIQHNPAAWLPVDLPIDIAASYYTQNLKIGDLFETSATAFGINVSKEIGWAGLNITPYGGYMRESSKMRVTYDMQYDMPDGSTGTIPIDFEMTGENTNRITAGLSVRFLLININADYNWGQYNSVSAGITIRI